ncbi:MAG TPA: SOS response-associated peptidase family protein, partial [Candidatus Saccharimonadales bacterium]|nr:SOS response-associated peptidase family protein [Candidatus Saccharimonadales bacterium]
MCGRYTEYDSEDDLLERYGTMRTPPKLSKNYNVAPGQIMPVITEDHKGKHLVLMKWGLIPVWAKDPSIGYKLINAR